MKCAKGYEIKPLKSAAGWYLGTVDVNGFPNCRLTSNYAPTKEDALRLFMDRQMASENEFCNDGCGCIVHYQKVVNPGYYNSGFIFQNDEVQHTGIHSYIRDNY